jgi:hypothetical protein
VNITNLLGNTGPIPNIPALEVDGDALVAGNMIVTAGAYSMPSTVAGSVYETSGFTNTLGAITGTYSGPIPSYDATVYSFTGGGGGRFNYPDGVAVIPSSGVIVVADTNNNRIRLVTQASVVTTLAGSGATGSANGTGTAASFNGPNGVAVLSDGNIVVADTGNHRIRLVTYPGGVVTTLAGSGSAAFADGTGTAASFWTPTGVAVLSDGNIVVADAINNRIRLVTYPGGVVTTLAGSSSAAFANGTGAAASFNYPYGVAVLSNGNIVVADSTNQRIRYVTYPAGAVTTLAGSSSGSAGFADGTGAAASFYEPHGVAVLSNGTIVVADMANQRIRLVATSTYTLNSGVVTTLAGSSQGSADGTGAAASFSNPFGVAVLSNGTIVVADTYNHLIRLVATSTYAANSGVVTTLAGTAGTGSFADGQIGGTFVVPAGAPVIVDYLIVGGGGGGGYNDGAGGGGGAGGLVYAKGIQLPAGTYTWTVGVGGAGTVGPATTNGTNGSPSSLSNASFGNVVALGGGGGGSTAAASDGASGGGGRGGASPVSGGNNAIGQGNIGGSNTAGTSIGTGGGGAGTPGVYTNSPPYITGGSGLAIPITGSNVYYAGGGGGANAAGSITTYSPGGAGGGGGGAYFTSITTSGLAGTANTGGGGGGALQYVSTNGTGGSGGSGIIIIRVYTNIGSRMLIGDGSGYSLALSAQSNAVTRDVMTVTDQGNVTIGLGNALFSSPGDAKFDSLGNLYVADYDNNRIRKISPSGIVSTLVGNGFPSNGIGTGTGSYIFSTYSLSVYDVGGVGYLFVGGNALIYQITLPGGVVTWLAGSGTSGSNDGSTGSTSTFTQPRGLYTDGTYVYVAEYAVVNSIRRVTISTGQTQTLSTSGWATNPGTKPTLGNVTSLVTDGTTIYYTNRTATVYKILSAGASVGTAISSAAFSGAYGIQYGNSAKTLLYVTNESSYKVSSLPTSGTSGTAPTIIAGSGTSASVDGTGTTASFVTIQNFAVDSAFSNLYIPELTGNKIRKLNLATSNVTTYAGTGVAGFADGSVPTSTVVNNALFVNGATSGGFYYLSNTTTALTAALSGPNSSGNVVLSNGTSNGPYVTRGGVSWTTGSDSRMKTVVSNLSNATELLSGITPVYFTYNEDPGKKQHVGVLAQEVLPVFPDIVASNADPTAMMGVDYGAFAAPLITAIKELSARLSNVEARLAATTTV